MSTGPENRPNGVRHGDRGPGMSMIVRTVTRWLKGPILLFGIYIVLYGHITPGGGFGGGVIIASAFILIILARGEQEGLGVFSKGAASRLDSVGLLIFLAVGWLGSWMASGYFFENLAATPEQARFTLFSAGSMPLMNLALGLKVASALFLVFTVLTALHIASPWLNDGAGSEDKDRAADGGQPDRTHHEDNS
ncbi:MAG: MnhB domain-containing protein [Thiogranum sp.]